MIRHLMKCYIVLLTQIIIIKGIQPYNNTSNESRHPRGRIVKLYSGYKPEPITCNNEGFLAEPTDCSIFYRCIKSSRDKYTVVKFQCSPGTVYDPEIETCNHPQNTKRSECRSSRPFQFITAPVEHINDNDIEPAVHEVPSPITTRKPIYDKQTSISELPSTSTHFPSIIPIAIQSPVYGVYGPTNQFQSTIKSQTNEIKKTTELQKPMSSIISTTQSQRTRPANQYGFTTSNTAASLGNECVHDGFMGDTEDCRKFYRCVNNQRGEFKKIEFICSESTIWDDDIQSCNHPWAVRHRRCGRDTSPSDLTSNISKQEDYHSNQNDRIIENELSNYESNRTKNTVMDVQLSTSNQISYGDRINSDKKIAGNKNMTNNITKNQERQTNSPIREKETDYITQSYETITKASSYIPDTGYSTNHPNYKVINNLCTESGFMGDPQNCRKFYRCVENERGSFIRHEFQCGEGTAWDKNIESCNHIWMVKECSARGNSNSFTSKKYDTENMHTTLSNIIKDDVASVNNDYNLQNYNNQHIARPTTMLPIVTQILKEPPKLNGSTEVCSSVGFMGNRNNCKIFYRCIENSNGGFTKFEYLCDEGTAWDPNIEACNHAELVKHCGFNVENRTKASTSSTESTIITTVSFVQVTVQSTDNNFVNDLSYISTNHRGTTAKSFTTSQVLGTEENKCKESGFMADSFDCRKFYRCVDNGNRIFIRFEYLCGEGTVWDENINACNHLWAVENCGSKHSHVLNESTPLPLAENDDNSYYNHTNNIYKDPIRITESTTVVNLSNITATNFNKVNACVNSGFIGDELDCKKFYRCVSNGDGSFKQYEFSCGEGTVWDPEIEACNHAWAVKNCGGSSYNQNTVSTARSTTLIIVPNNEFDSGYTTHVYNNQTKLPVENTIGLSTTKAQGDKSLQCQSAGFMADKKDCKRFYRCVENGLGGFDRFEFSCGEGTVWDSNIQSCNHASSVKDCSTVKYNTTTLVEITTKSMATVSVQVDKNVPAESEVESPTTIKTSYANSTCTSDGFYGDKNDCKKFYRCVINQQGDFVKYEFSCGEGTVWDPNIQSCNHATADNINCKGSTISSITKEPPSVMRPGSTESYTTLYFEGISTQENSNYIPDMGNNCVAEGFYSNSKDCKKFFRCVSNGKGYIRYDFTCGEGTIWVQAIQACDHESDNSTCTTEPVTVNEGYVSTTTHTTSSHINTERSEAPNTNMEPNKTSTDWNIQRNECYSEGYFEKANDCRQFYRCVLNDHGTYTKYDYICSEGTAWDIDKQSCNHVDTVKRCQSTNVQNIQSPTMNQFEEETKTTEAIMTTKPSTSTPESISTKEDALNIVECESEGYFGNKEDCQKFYRCVDDGKGHFVKYDFICGDGTIWDKDILTCNHPRDVTNQSCNNETTNATSTTNTETSIQSTTSISSSTQSSSTSSISTQTASTSTSMTQTATSSISTQTPTSSPSTQAPTPSSSTKTTVSSISTETTTSSYEGSSQETAICSGEASSKNPTNQNITCTKAGFFAHPSDCKKFYRCVDWDGNGQKFSIFHFECGEGTIWDPALDTCNYEESVYPPRNCSATQAQNNNNSQTTTTDPTTKTEAATTPQPSSSETTSTLSTPTEEPTTEQQSSTNQMSSSTTSATDTTSTTMTSIDTTSTTVAYTDITSTTVTPTDTTSTTSTTDITSTQSDKSTTTTVELSTNENTSSASEQTTISEKTTTTTEVTTSMTEQQSSTTLEPSSTEQSTTQTAVSATEETTLQGSTAEQQSSTEPSTEISNTSSTTETSPTSTGSTTESTDATTTQGSTTVKDCPDTEDDQYLYVCPTSFKRHPKYCNLFYQCIENNDNHELKIATFNCPNGTIYDESKIQCVEEGKAEKKCQGVIAENRRIKRLNFYNKDTISVSENKYACSGVGHYPFEKNEECSPAILKCDISKRGKLQGFVYRCPDNYIYWSVSRRCEPISTMSTCKNSLNQWNGRSEIPIERKNLA